MTLRRGENGTHPGVGIFRSEQGTLVCSDGDCTPFQITGVDVAARFVRVRHHSADTRTVHQSSVRRLYGVHGHDTVPRRQQRRHVRECLPRVRSDDVPLLHVSVGEQTVSGVGDPRRLDVHSHVHPAVMQTEWVSKCCPLAPASLRPRRALRCLQGARERSLSILIGHSKQMFSTVPTETR